MPEISVAQELAAKARAREEKRVLRQMMAPLRSRDERVILENIPNVRNWVNAAGDESQRSVRLKSILSLQNSHVIKAFLEELKAWISSATEDRLTERLQLILTSRCQDLINCFVSEIVGRVEAATGDEQLEWQKRVLASHSYVLISLLTPRIVARVKSLVGTDNERLTIELKAVLASRNFKLMNELQAEIVSWAGSAEVSDLKRVERLKLVLSTQNVKVVLPLQNEIMSWLASTSGPEHLACLDQIISSNALFKAYQELTQSHKECLINGIVAWLNQDNGRWIKIHYNDVQVEFLSDLNQKKPIVAALSEMDQSKRFDLLSYLFMAKTRRGPSKLSNALESGQKQVFDELVKSWMESKPERCEERKKKLEKCPAFRHLVEGGVKASGGGAAKRKALSTVHAVALPAEADGPSPQKQVRVQAQTRVSSVSILAQSARRPASDSAAASAPTGPR